MGNEKKTMVAMLILAIAAVAICAGTIVFLNSKKEPLEKKIVLEEPKPEEEIEKKEEKEFVTKVVKTEPKTPTPTNTPLTEEEKRKKRTEEWKQASKEMMEMFQGSKMQELIHKRMSARNKEYLADLFEKYGVDAETQDLIAETITQSQSQFMQTLMSSGFRNDRDNEEKRAEIAKKLAAINQEAEDNIMNAAGAAFLADAKEKRNTELRNANLKRLNWRLRDNKMTDEQQNAMDALYAQNQITEVEMFTLPKEEIDRRKENINSGAREILSEEQYSSYEKSNWDPFRTRGMRGMGGRGRRRR